MFPAGIQLPIKPGRSVLCNATTVACSKPEHGDNRGASGIPLGGLPVTDSLPRAKYRRNVGRALSGVGPRQTMRINAL